MRDQGNKGWLETFRIGCVVLTLNCDDITERE